MNILLSIRPKYVEAIMKGNKRYEFRKTIFRKRDIERALIYSTAPVKKLVGYFIIGDIVESHPNTLWDQFKEFSGLNEEEFFSYFNGSKRGFAIHIEEVERFPNALDPTDLFPDFTPPQSFYYLDMPLIPEGTYNE